MLIIIGFLFMIFMFVLLSSIETALVILDMPSIIAIIISLIFFFITTKSGKAVMLYVKHSFQKNYKYSKTELQSIVHAIKSIIKFTLGVGVFGFLLGIIISFYLSTSEAILVNISVSLVMLLYTVALSLFVFYPTQVWAENKSNEGV